MHQFEDEVFADLLKTAEDVSKEAAPWKNKLLAPALGLGMALRPGARAQQPQQPSAQVEQSKKGDYQMGVLQKHLQRTDRVGTDFNTIQCDQGRCVGDATGIYQTKNWWDIRVDGGTWVLQPNFQDDSKHDPLEAANEGDKILFRIGERHYLNGKATVAYLPRTDDPKKEIMLMAQWISDQPVAPQNKPKPKSQLEAVCDSGKLSPEQQKQYCTTETPAVAPAPDATPAKPALPSPTEKYPPTEQSKSDPRVEQFRKMCNGGTFKPGRDDFSIQQCEIMFPSKK